jgi:hypothetical protein
VARQRSSRRRGDRRTSSPPSSPSPSLLIPRRQTKMPPSPSRLAIPTALYSLCVFSVDSSVRHCNVWAHHRGWCPSSRSPPLRFPLLPPLHRCCPLPLRMLPCCGPSPPLFGPRCTLASLIPPSLSLHANGLVAYFFSPLQ